MQKIKVSIDIILTIVLGFFFVLSLALYFALPYIDAAVVPSAVDGMLPYEPFTLLLAGILALASFAFARVEYIILFVTTILLVVALIVWLVAIIVGKKPRKLFLWAIISHVVVFSIILASALMLPACRAVYVVGEDVESPLFQIFIKDLFGEYDNFLLDQSYYEAQGLWIAENAELFVNEEGVVAVPTFLFNGGVTYILSYVEFFAIPVVALIALFTPIFSSVFLFASKRSVEDVEESEEQRLAREKAEQARKLRQERYVTYVEYEAGKSSRDKEYIELCRANGIALPADLKEAEENAYYSDIAKSLPVLNGEPIEDPEELYYDELKRILPVFTGEYIEDSEEAYYNEIKRTLPVFTGEYIENPEEAYYNEIKRTLPVFTGEYIEDPREAYYSGLAKELPVLNGEPIEDPKVIYYESLKKELPVLKEYRGIPKGESKDEYVARLSKEIPIIRDVDVTIPKPEKEEEYIARLSKELPLLKNRGQSVEKGESNEEYHARLAKELPLFQQEQEIHIGRGETQKQYNKRLEKELGLFHEDKEAEIEEQIRNLKRSEANKKAYYEKMKAALPCLNESATAEDE